MLRTAPPPGTHPALRTMAKVHVTCAANFIGSDLPRTNLFDAASLKNTPFTGLERNTKEAVLESIFYLSFYFT